MRHRDWGWGEDGRWGWDGDGNQMCADGIRMKIFLGMGLIFTTVSL